MVRLTFMMRQQTNVEYCGAFLQGMIFCGRENKKVNNCHGTMDHYIWRMYPYDGQVNHCDIKVDYLLRQWIIVRRSGTLNHNDETEECSGDI